MSARLSVFSNLSLVSDDYFDHTELGEEGETSELAITAPSFKFKLGGTSVMWIHTSCWTWVLATTSAMVCALT